MVFKVIASSIRDQVKDASGSDAGNEALKGDVKNVLTGIMAAVGVVAVIIIIIGGVNYMMSQGDPSKIAKAKKTLIGGIIGLIVVLLAFAIVNFVLEAMQ
jgi:hypothetical protein